MQSLAAVLSGYSVPFQFFAFGGLPNSKRAAQEPISLLLHAGQVRVLQLDVHR